MVTDGGFRFIFFELRKGTLSSAVGPEGYRVQPSIALKCSLCSLFITDLRISEKNILPGLLSSIYLIHNLIVLVILEKVKRRGSAQERWVIRTLIGRPIISDISVVPTAICYPLCLARLLAMLLKLISVNKPHTVLHESQHIQFHDSCFPFNSSGGLNLSLVFLAKVPTNPLRAQISFFGTVHILLISQSSIRLP